MTAPEAPGDRRRALVPRLLGQGYEDEQIAERRAWVERQTGCRLSHVGATTLAGPAMRGNVENPIGAAQVPLGVAGPLEVAGEHARGTFYVPLATTEGALVRSYERGMLAITRAGGATVRLLADENTVCPVLVYADAAAAVDAARRLPELLPALAAAGEATTRHGRLRAAVPTVVGRRLYVALSWSTGDAHGMNMIVRASDAAAEVLARATGAGERLAMSGMSSEKRASGALLAGGKGKRAVAAVRLPRRVLRSVLETDAPRMAATWHATVLGHLAAGALGYNGHLANGLTALFIACGQDVANVANCAVGITDLEATPEGDLHASVMLPSLTVATVGGGTALGTARECLEMLGCFGDGRAPKLAEVLAATLLAGEISMAAAIANGEMVAAHETYGRNRPAAGEAP
ncbi:MAG TPA: hydroxymethylglutaryl-CoA reductase [Thermoanaerobaculia bacterium]|nr:hydroxymethylglutaryl-CoA reductase [Thermoanaerobaculia bacterium]